MAIIDTLLDLLSAASGALVGAIVTALFNRGRHQKLNNQILMGRKELARIQAENERLLGVVQDREKTIMEMQMKILQYEGAKSKPRTTKPKTKK